MADCIIKPSFLRGFDFKLLYSTEGDETYRVMSHDPLGGELLCLPWGHRNILRSVDWGYTFERIEDVLTPNTSSPISNVAFAAAYGLGEHHFVTINSKDLGPVPVIVSDQISMVLQIHRLVSLSDGPTARRTGFGTISGSGVGFYPAGIGYANGCFYSALYGGSGSVRDGNLGVNQWRNDAAEMFALSSNPVNAKANMIMWPLTRGAYLYGARPYAQANNVAEGRYVGIRRRYLPMTAAQVPPAEDVAYFIDAETKVELTDLQNYSGVQPDGAVAIERDGRMWHCTGTGLTGWVQGDAPPTFSIDTNFPHIAAGQGRFGEPVLLSLDISGSYGLLSVDHGQTSQLFELPGEVGLTLPGGVGIVPGADDQRFPRAYDLKYISDPATNHTRGRWILCGGQAVWELIPRYGE